MSSVSVNQEKEVPLKVYMKSDKVAATGYSASLGIVLWMLQLMKFPRRPLPAHQLSSTIMILSPGPVHVESESQNQGNASTLVAFIFHLCASLWSQCRQRIATRGLCTSHYDASGSSAQERDKATASSAKRKRALNKKGKAKATEENPDDQLPDANASRLLESDAERSEASERPGILCPFFLFNPIEYVECAAHPQKDYDRTKTHITRKHTVKDDHYCPNCFSIFENPEDAAVHLERARNHIDHCPAVAGYDQIPPQEWEDVFLNEVDKCPRSSDDEEKYFWLWDRLFPGQQRPELIRTRGLLFDLIQALIRPEYLQSIVQQVLLRVDLRDSYALSQEISNSLVNIERGPRHYRKSLQRSVNHEAQIIPLEAHMAAAHTLWDYHHQEPESAGTQLPESWPAQMSLEASPRNEVTTWTPTGVGDSTSSGLDMLPPGLTDLPLDTQATVAVGVFNDPIWESSGIERQGGMQLSAMSGMPTIEVGENEARSVPILVPELAWDIIKHYPISWVNADGPKWVHARDYIDMSQLSLEIPILENQIARFRALEAGG